MQKINKQKTVNFWLYMLPFTVFTKEIGMIEFGGIQFDFISYPFFVLAFAYFFLVKKIKISKIEFLVFAYLLLGGVLIALMLHLPIIAFFKQFIPIVIIFFSTKAILNNFDAIKIFNIYVKFAIVAAAIGILQIVLRQAGIFFLTPFSGFTVDSVALEPSHYVAMVLPALVYMFEKKEYNWKFYLLLLTLLLTFKLTALLSIVIYLLIRNLKKFYWLLMSMIVFVPITAYVINENPEFADRIDSALIFLQSGDVSEVENLTTFSFTSNLDVAMTNFINTFGLGVGLGGHEATYYKNLDHLGLPAYMHYGINANSAHALTIRIVSEMGIVGILLFLMIFYKTLHINNHTYKIVALASLSHYIVTSLKLGGYFDYGTIFFFVMILTMVKLDKKEISRSEVNR